MVCFAMELLVTGPGIPGIDSLRGGFLGGVHTKYRSFLVPKYPEMIVNDRYDESEEESEEESEDEAEEEKEEEYVYQRPSYRRNSSKMPKTTKQTLPPTGNKKKTLYASDSRCRSDSTFIV